MVHELCTRRCIELFLIPTGILRGRYYHPILQMGKWSLRGRRNDTAKITQLGSDRATDLGHHFAPCRARSLTTFCPTTIQKFHKISLMMFWKEVEE